jgi:hypothetical protein
LLISPASTDSTNHRPERVRKFQKNKIWIFCVLSTMLTCENAVIPGNPAVASHHFMDPCLYLQTLAEHWLPWIIQVYTVCS